MKLLLRPTKFTFTVYDFQEMKADDADMPIAMQASTVLNHE